jgi:aerobic carbon-monoxide dehydrogenase medium subunit
MDGFELAEPQSLEEALALVDSSDSSVRAMGGGTALMLMMKAQLFQPSRLVSLKHLGPPFTGFGLNAEGTSLRIGAMTTFSMLEHAPIVRQHFPVIVETMRTLANVRVRNVATIGGNIAHGDPHLDLPPVWVALDADVLIISRRGERAIAVEDMFVGYYETALGDGELIAELRVPVRPNWRSRYVKVTTRAAHDWPAIGLAVSLCFAGDRVEDARIVLSAALDKPTRLAGAEAALRRERLDEDVLRRVADVAASEVEIESDSRGSAAYKTHLLRVHLARALLSLAPK